MFYILFAAEYFLNFDDKADENGYGFLKNMGPPFSMSDYVGSFFLDYTAADSLKWDYFVQRVMNVFNDSHFTQQIVQSQGLDFSTMNRKVSHII